MKGLLSFLFALTASLVFAQAPAVVINEINADNPGGGDTREFIELYGAPNTSLNGLTLVFFDGATLLSYNAIDLSAYSTNNFGFFVAGNALTTNVNLTWANGLMQNGSDAVALYYGPVANYPNGTALSGANLVDAAVYGTADTPITALITGLTLDVLAPGYTQFDETAQFNGTDLTQSRIPDGGAPFFNTTYVLQALTPGTWNQPPCTSGTSTLVGGATTATFCNNAASVVNMTPFSGTGTGLFVAVDATGNIVSTFSNTYDFIGLSGVYKIYAVGYAGTLNAASIAAGQPFNAISASTCLSVSTTFVTVTMNVCSGCIGGTVFYGTNSTSYTDIIDAAANVITLGNTSTSSTATYVYALTDNTGNFIQWVTSSFDYNTLAAGTYQVHGLSYEGTLTAPAVGANITTGTASTCAQWSTNFITINALQVANVLINELNSDNPGFGGAPDAAEFIELFGTQNSSLNGLTLVLFDGATLVSYGAYDLDGYSTDAQGFFVAGSATVTNVDFIFPTATNVIQNGADAIALFAGNATDFPNGTALTSNNLIDAMTYGTADATIAGLITGLGITTPGYVQLDETAQTNGTDLTISRVPDGGTAFSTAYTTQALTPGTWNQPPCSSGTALLADGTNAVTICSNANGTVNMTAFNGTGNGIFVATDASGNITSTNTSTFDFTGLVGVHHIYAVGYTTTLNTSTTATGLPVSGITASQCVSISTAFTTVTITPCTGCSGGTVAANTNQTSVSVNKDGNADVLNLTTTSLSTTDTYVYALTDVNNNFIQWVAANFDFNTLALGTYHVWGISYEGTLTAPAVGANVNTAAASTCLQASSNSILVNVIQVANVVINELNADNPGGPDTAEFIELYGDVNASLNGLVMVFYDGLTGVSYAAYDLDTYTTNAQGFFVIGDAGAANVGLTIPNGSLQNGQDAIALYIGNGTDFPNGTAPTGANMVDAMVYGTADPTATNLITGLGLDILVPGYVQFDETAQTTGVDLTQSRVPDGGPAFINTNVVLQALTPGTYNIVILGCTDPTACNYNPEATVNDNTCSLPGGTCDDGNAGTINDVYDANCNCAGTALPAGCMDATACNYDPTALFDNGTCTYPGSACDDLDPNTINDVLDANCLCVGTAGVLGCMDLNACNYNAAATFDDGSCLFIGTTCDDGDPNTVNDAIDFTCTCVGVIIGVTEVEGLNAISVFPNPTQNSFTVTFSSTVNEAIQVRVTDITGKTIHTERRGIQVGKNTFTLPSENWSNGIYILQINNEETSVQMQLMKN